MSVDLQAVSELEIKRRKRPWSLIVIPKGARELFSIQPGDQLLLMADKKRGIALVSMDDLNVPDALFRMAKEAEDDADPEA